MSLDSEFAVPLGRGCIEQVRPKGIVADERRAERVHMVLGIVGKEAYPGVAVERLPRPPVGLEEISGRRVVHHHFASRRCSNRSPIR